jgi:hypothetical protein
VYRERVLEVEVQIGFDRKDLSTVYLLGVSLTSPSKGFGIKTYENYGYPWK